MAWITSAPAKQHTWSAVMTNTAYHITPNHVSCISGEGTHQGVPPVQTGLPPLRVGLQKGYPSSFQHAISQQALQVAKHIFLSFGSGFIP